MSSFNDKIDQIFSVLSTANARQHASTKAIEQLNAEIVAINGQISQLTEQVSQVVAENQREQEDVREVARRYTEWWEQVQAMQADVHLILQHLGQEMEDGKDGADGGKER